MTGVVNALSNVDTGHEDMIVRYDSCNSHMTTT